MKTAESKTTSTQSARQPQRSGEPFFNKGGQGSFFSEQPAKADFFFHPSTIQPKLTVGKPNDKYEKEADAMAEKVVAQLTNGSQQTAVSTGQAAANGSGAAASASVQAKCAECGQEEQLQKKEGEEEMLQTDLQVQHKAIFESNEEPPASQVQAKFSCPAAVQPKCAECEQDEQVQKEEESAGEEPKLQTNLIFDSAAEPPEEDTVQRMCAECAAEEKESEQKKETSPVMKKEDGATASSASPNLESRLSAAKGGGSSLPEGARSEMEGAFGADFSGVRVHSDSTAVQMNKELGAQAFTHGSDIYFNSGKYDTESPTGKGLLAHELTHTVQQGKASQQNSITQKKGIRTQTEQVPEDSIQKAPCSNWNPPAEQPNEDQEEPKEEEAPKDIEATEGESCEARQAKAPDPAEFAPPPAENITEEAQAETGIEEAVQPNDAVLENSEGKEPGGQAEAETEVQNQQESLDVATGEAASEITAQPEGMGEAASPLLQAERDEASFSMESTTRLLSQTAAALGSVGSKSPDFAEPPPAEKKKQTPAESRAYQERKTASSSLAKSFLAGAVGNVMGLVSLGLQIPIILAAETAAKKSELSGKIEQRRSQISALAQELATGANTKAAIAKAQIRTKHTITTILARAATLQAKAQVEGEFLVAKQLLDEKKAAQLLAIEQIYADSYNEYTAVGQRVGDAAAARAETAAWEFEAEKTGEKDGFWDGYLTDNRWQARADSARETGKQYRCGMIKEGNKQAEEAMKGKAKDIETVEAIYTQSLQAITATKDSTLQALDSNLDNTLQQAENSRQSLLSTISSSLQATLHSFAEQEASQLQFLADYGIRQQMSIERDAQNAGNSIAGGVNDAAGQILSALRQFVAMTAGIMAPEPEQFKGTIAAMSANVDGAIDQATNMSAQAADSSRSGLMQGAQQATGAFDIFSESGIENLQAVFSGFESSIDSLVANGIAGYEQLFQTFSAQTQQSLTQATQTFESVKTGIQQAFETVNTNLQTYFAQSVQDLETKLMATLDEDLQEKICAEADKAAKEVQPWWKSVLKILLVIIVIVVVALVIGPAVIGAVGAAAGALGASAGVATFIGATVGGAIVGAFAGGVIQVGNNAIDGKNLMDGVGKAMIVGAIGGALGGLGGQLAQGLAQAGKLGAAGLMQTSMKFGTEMAFDVAGGIIGDLAVGNPITLEGVLVGAAIGAAVQISTANLSNLGRVGQFAEGIQASSMKFGEGIGTSIGGRISGIGGEAAAPHISTTEPDIHIETPGASKVDAGTAGDAGARPDTTPTGAEPAPARVDEPSANHPAEPSTARVDEPSATHPAEPSAAKTEEPSFKADEETPPGSRSENEPTPGSIRGEQTSASGHDVKVLADGTIVRCTTCAKLGDRYQVELANPKNEALAARFEEIKAMPEGQAKADAAAELEASLSRVKETGEVSHKRWDDPTLTKAEMIADYKAENPSSGLDDYDIGIYYDQKFRVNPETGAFKRPVQAVTGEPRANLPEPGSEAHTKWMEYLRTGKGIPCFPPGTIVKTPTGNRRIEELATGDWVLAYDKIEFNTIPKRILSHFENWALQIVEIQADGEKFTATMNHPFWVENENKYYRADHLQTGWQLRTAAGHLKTIENINLKLAQIATYNLEVEELHNYFVGDTGVLVHNDDIETANASKFADTTAYPSNIYVIRDPNTRKVIYVGQTIQDVEVRLKQHLTNPDSAIFQYLKENGHPGLADNPNLLAEVDPRRVLNWTTPPPSGSKLTPYELSVWEQRYIDGYGGIDALENKINAITPEKMQMYRNLHNPCS